MQFQVWPPPEKALHWQSQHWPPELVQQLVDPLHSPTRAVQPASTPLPLQVWPLQRSGLVLRQLGSPLQGNAAYAAVGRPTVAPATTPKTAASVPFSTVRRLMNLVVLTI